MGRFITYSRNLVFAVALLLAASCTTKLDSDTACGFAGEIRVGASAGQKSISVEADRSWTVYEEDSAPWVHFDVPGGNGNGAFTVYFDSNESDIANFRPSRLAKIIVSSLDGRHRDRICMVQSGVVPGDFSIPSSTAKNSFNIEFEESQFETLDVVYCCTDGLDADGVQFLVSWASSLDAAVAITGSILPQNAVTARATFMYSGTAECESIMGGKALVARIGDLNFAVADFDPDADLLRQFKSLIDESYNNPSNHASKWFVGGSLYHYSMMETGYPDTPAWYPDDALGLSFAADRYAWQNNLLDCIWMNTRNWTPTYVPAQGEAYRADYVYASREAASLVQDMKIMDCPVPGMTHKPVKFTINQ